MAANMTAFAIAVALVCLLRLPDAITAWTPQHYHVSFQNHLASSMNSRRRLLGSIVSASLVIFPTTELLSPQAAVASTATTVSLESIHWDLPKNRGLNTERMADAINDGIKETEWPVTGYGRPELFSDDFIFTFAKQNIKGYESYCRFVRQQYSKTDAKCELVCCSVTGPHAISALWRLSPEPSKVIRSEFTTNPKDGLVVRQVDTLVLTEAPLLEELQMRCDWYTCNLRS